MSENLGQSVVVEKRPGAGSNIATSDVAHAPPDGYMLMLLTTANVINATLYTNLNYDLLRDIAPAGSIDDEPFVLEVNRRPAKTLPDSSPMQKLIRRRSRWHLPVSAARRTFSGMFQRMAGIQLIHVPYKAIRYLTYQRPGRLLDRPRRRP